MRPPSESNRVCTSSRRLSIDMSRLSVSGAASSLFGGEQRIRWCSLVCLPELRESSGTPSESHASHMKRLSDSKARHVSNLSRNSIIQIGTDLRKTCSTRTGRRGNRYIYHTLASLRSEVAPAWRFLRRFPPHPSYRSRSWSRLSPQERHSASL
jgi:hypothetical protein